MMLNKTLVNFILFFINILNYQKESEPLSMRDLVERCKKDKSFVNFICNTVENSQKVKK